MIDRSKYDRVSTTIGWIYAVILLVGYFYIICPPLFPDWVTAPRIVRDLRYKDVRNSHLLVLSKHENETQLLENALVLVEFKTNVWRLLRAMRPRPDPNGWRVVIVHDRAQRGRRDFKQLPTEAEVEAFLRDENWFFESTQAFRFLSGSIFSNTWETALRYTPTHTWVSPTEVRSTNSHRMIQLLNEFVATSNEVAQLQLIKEFVSLPNLEPSRRERVPFPIFIAVGLSSNHFEYVWSEVDTNQVNHVIVHDSSGEPPLFEGGLVAIHSREALQHISQWMLKQQQMRSYCSYTQVEP